MACWIDIVIVIIIIIIDVFIINVPDKIINIVLLMQLVSLLLINFCHSLAIISDIAGSDLQGDVWLRSWWYRRSEYERRWQNRKRGGRGRRLDHWNSRKDRSERTHTSHLCRTDLKKATRIFISAFQLFTIASMLRHKDDHRRRNLFRILVSLF